MDNAGRINMNESKKDITILQHDIKQEPSDTFVFKRDSKNCINTSNMFDEKDLLIAQLQEQVAKQRECISYYESIVQLMNYRLMKLKKVLKAHQLLGELD